MSLIIKNKYSPNFDFKKKIGYWHNINQSVLSKSRYLAIDKYEQKNF